MKNLKIILKSIIICIIFSYSAFCINNKETDKKENNSKDISINQNQESTIKAKKIKLSNDVISKNYALVIGINEYDDKSHLPNLNYAVNDAKRISKTLKKNNQYEVYYIADDSKIKPTKENILHAFKLIENLANLGKINKLFIFFSGHGYVDKNTKTNYLTSRDTKVKNLKETAINLNDILLKIKNLKHVDKKLIFLDACREILNIKGLSNTYLPQKSYGMYVVFSTQYGSLSYEEKKFRSGVFAYFLNKALNGSADSNKDGNVSFFEVMTYLNTKITKWSFSSGKIQIPVFSSIGEGSGDITVLSYSRNGAKGLNNLAVYPYETNIPANFSKIKKIVVFNNLKGDDDSIDVRLNDEYLIMKRPIPFKEEPYGNDYTSKKYKEYYEKQEFAIFRIEDLKKSKGILPEPISRIQFDELSFKNFIVNNNYIYALFSEKDNRNKYVSLIRYKLPLIEKDFKKFRLDENLDYDIHYFRMKLNQTNKYCNFITDKWYLNIFNNSSKKLKYNKGILNLNKGYHSGNIFYKTEGNFVALDEDRFVLNSTVFNLKKNITYQIPAFDKDSSANPIRQIIILRTNNNDIIATNKNNKIAIFSNISEYLDGVENEINKELFYDKWYNSFWYKNHQEIETELPLKYMYHYKYYQKHQMFSAVMQNSFIIFKFNDNYEFEIVVRYIADFQKDSVRYTNLLSSIEYDLYGKHLAIVINSLIKDSDNRHKKLILFETK